MVESFRSSGIITKQAHVRIPANLYEEEHGRRGFFGRVSQLYHESPPTAWTKVKGELRPRAIPSLFSLLEHNTFAPLLFNRSLILSLGRLDGHDHIFHRNASADEIFFIHQGTGRVETSYGVISLRAGDYLVMPKGVTYQWYADQASHGEMLVVRLEGFLGEFEQPDRGLLGPNALYDQTAITYPEASVGTLSGLEEYQICIRHGESMEDMQETWVSYAFNPLDVKGWKGSLYPWKLSIYDLCPVMSHRYHMPPSAHTTFVAKEFVVCSFVARPLEETKEGVLKVPFYHSNIDYDEVLFYHAGDFFSRDNIAPGFLTFHPAGIHHGPHPKAFKSADEKERTNEFAMMVDTRLPLKRSEFFKKHEIVKYVESWKENR